MLVISVQNVQPRSFILAPLIELFSSPIFVLVLPFLAILHNGLNVTHLAIFKNTNFITVCASPANALYNLA